MRARTIRLSLFVSLLYWSVGWIFGWKNLSLLLLLLSLLPLIHILLLREHCPAEQIKHRTQHRTACPVSRGLEKNMVEQFWNCFTRWLNAANSLTSCFCSEPSTRQSSISSQNDPEYMQFERTLLLAAIYDIEGNADLCIAAGFLHWLLLNTHQTHFICWMHQLIKHQLRG